jgi:hypothetical protein
VTQSELQAIDDVVKYLPLLQAIAAVASIGGAFASWRFAKRAARARDEMTANAVAADCLATLARARQTLSTGCRAIQSSGKEWYPKVLELKSDLRESMSEARGAVKAAAPYLAGRVASVDSTTKALDEALNDMLPQRLDRALEAIMATIEELRIAANARSVAGHGG